VREQLSKAQHETVNEGEDEVYRCGAEQFLDGGRFVEDYGG